MTVDEAMLALIGLNDALDEIAAEFMSKKRAADWKIVNEGMLGAERALRRYAGKMAPVPRGNRFAAYIKKIGGAA